MILSVHQSSWCCWGAIDLWVAHSRIALVRVCGSFVTQVSSPCSFNSPLKPGMLACVRGACQGSSTHTHTHRGGNHPHSSTLRLTLPFRPFPVFYLFHCLLPVDSAFVFTFVASHRISTEPNGTETRRSFE